MKEYTLDQFIKDECSRDEKFKKECIQNEDEREFILSMIKARKQRNLTQKDLAKLCGVTQSKISKIENGDANPTLKVLRKIANALNMNIIFVPKDDVQIQTR